MRGFHTHEKEASGPSERDQSCTAIMSRGYSGAWDGCAKKVDFFLMFIRQIWSAARSGLETISRPGSCRSKTGLLFLPQGMQKQLVTCLNIPIPHEGDQSFKLN